MAAPDWTLVGLTHANTEKKKRNKLELAQKNTQAEAWIQIHAHKMTTRKEHKDPQNTLSMKALRDTNESQTGRKPTSHQ